MDEDPWREESVTPRRARDAVFHDEPRVRRLKSLGLTTPLHELEGNKGQRGWEAHNLLELGLSASTPSLTAKSLKAASRPTTSRRC